RADLLEHPAEAFADFRSAGVEEVVCEEKHMGSRAVVVLCRDQEAASTRFGAAHGETGAVYTRTGRSFFRPDVTELLLRRLRDAVTSAALWEELDTGWLVLDCELLPWSAKAEGLLREQYAAVGAAARAALPVALDLLDLAASRGLDIADLRVRTATRAANAEAFTAAYRQYCWETDGVQGIRVAPFQILASQGHTYSQRDHGWHLELADRLVAAVPELVGHTRRQVVRPDDKDSVATAVEWWDELTESGGEGMVVKPLGNLTMGRRGLVQPGIKVRGREYLRIIYGPDYTEPHNLERLRDRNVGHKRSLALREYALGIEALERLAHAEPLWRVHEPVFGVLALESEPVDPRL
ncbi:MAG: polynucleotide kinase-phosphatase, partial [Chloroflexota bacterium]|nr:polynucleotide kinase-phosphatase [Chloroflexota bacterium]